MILFSISIHLFIHFFVIYLSVFLTQTEYLQLASDLGNFQIRLLDRVRNSSELNYLLDNPAGAPIVTQDRLARLKYAIHLQQKRVSETIIFDGFLQVYGIPYVLS